MLDGPSNSPPTALGGAETTHAPLLSVITAAFVTVLVQAALAFQKYRFNNGLMLGATLAAVDWYEDTTRRKGLPPSRRIVLLIATSAAALALALQQVARVFVTGLPPPSRTRDNPYVDIAHFCP